MDEGVFDLNQFLIAKHIMTPAEKIEIFNEKSKLKDALKYLKSNNFDIAVVEMNSKSYGYIMREDIEYNRTKGGIRKHIKNISPEGKIPSNLPLEEVIKKFEKHHYLFIFDEDMFKGIITYADLNKTPIYVLLYSIISVFEVTMREIVKKRYENEREWLEKLSDKSQREIGGIFISEKAKGVETSLLECTTLTQLKEILEKDKEWIKICINNESGKNLSIKKKKEIFSEKMSKIINLRNAIMHRRVLINGKDGGKELYSIITRIKEDMKNLGEYL